MQKCRSEKCDNEFEPTMGRQVYCPSERCKEERERERHRQRRARLKTAKKTNTGHDR